MVKILDQISPSTGIAIVFFLIEFLRNAVIIFLKLRPRALLTRVQVWKKKMELLVPHTNRFSMGVCIDKLFYWYVCLQNQNHTIWEFAEFLCSLWKLKSRVLWCMKSLCTCIYIYTYIYIYECKIGYFLRQSNWWITSDVSPCEGFISINIYKYIYYIYI